MQYIGHGLVIIKDDQDNSVIFNVKQIIKVGENQGKSWITLPGKNLKGNPNTIVSPTSVDDFATQLKNILPPSN